MNDTLWKLLTVPTQELALLWNISAAEVRRKRLEYTGSARPLSEPWCYALGRWGGVQSIAEIAARLGLPPHIVRDYAKGKKLRAASPSRRRTHAELAVLLYAEHERRPQDSCRDHGVLLVERHLLCTYLEQLLEREKVRFETLLQWTPERLEEAWQRGGHSFDPPNPLTEEARADEFRAMLRKVRASVRARMAS